MQAISPFRRILPIIEDSLLEASIQHGLNIEAARNSRSKLDFKVPKTAPAKRRRLVTQALRLDVPLSASRMMKIEKTLFDSDAVSA
jgi:hypothetical protein